MLNKYVKIFSPIFSLALYACSSQPIGKIESPKSFGSNEVKIVSKLPVKPSVNNPSNHRLEFKYTADRGKVLVNNLSDTSLALYYAPFTGGPDTIRISVFDKTDNVNLPVISQNLQVQGESLTYVELPQNITKLGDTDNGVIQVASVRGSMSKKQIGMGRTPAISPDGRYIAYVVHQVDNSSQIMVQDPVGHVTNITNDDKSLNINPSWSPIGADGKFYLVFSSNRGNDKKKFHLWKINLETKELVQITKDECNDIQPDWSSDGRKIVFVSNLDNGLEKDYNNLFLLDISTGNKTQITHETISNKGISNPSWSSDTQKIVYTRKYQKRQIQALEDFQKIWMIDFTKNSEGFGQIATREFDKNIIESFPSWSPDARSIAFVRNRGAENTVVSVDFNTKIRFGSGLPINPTQEGDLTNVTELKWARQRSYGYSYGNGGKNSNPFAPSTMN